MIYGNLTPENIYSTFPVFMEIFYYRKFHYNLSKFLLFLSNFFPFFVRVPFIFLPIITPVEVEVMKCLRLSQYR